MNDRLTNKAPEPVRDALAVLHAKPGTLQRKVCNVASRNTPEAEAVFTLACGKRFEYTINDWRAVLNRVDNCELTIEEWLKGVE